MSRKKILADCAKHGGEWYVMHSDGMMFANRLSDFFVNEEDAHSAKLFLSCSYPKRELHIKQQLTLKELRAHNRRIKEGTERRVHFYVVAIDQRTAAYGKPQTISGIPVSRRFAGQFKAVRALRKARRNHPDAYIQIHTARSGLEGPERDRAMRTIVR